MKVYCTGGTDEESETLTSFCREKGWDARVMRRNGRPKGNYPVQKVLHAFRGGSGVKEIAERFSMSRRTVQRILTAEGLWPL